MKGNLILSTRLFEDRVSSVESALALGRDLGFLDFGLMLSPSDSVAEGISATLAERRLRVRCVQRPYALNGRIEAAERQQRSADARALDRAPDDAIADVVRLAEAARSLGSDVLVLPLGVIEWEGSAIAEAEVVQRLTARSGGNDPDPAAIVSLRQAAASGAGRAAERACRFLHAILKRLPEHRVALLGGRLPTDLAAPERLQWILDDFRGKPVHYWHHTGFAESQRALGLAEPGEWLDRLASRLIGVTLHDARGLETHLVPGRGTIDFRLLRDYVTDRCLRLLELPPGASASDVAEARNFLETEGLA